MIYVAIHYLDRAQCLKMSANQNTAVHLIGLYQFAI